MDLARSIAARFCPWPRLRQPSTSAEPAPAHLLGHEGEGIAARFLKARGFKVLYRNFKAPRGGEVDLVCRERETLVFVEVKTRSSTEFGRPSAAVNRSKQRLVSRGAIAWLRLLDNPDVIFRFDVVEVVVREKDAEVTLIREAFPLSEPFVY